MRRALAIAAVVATLPATAGATRVTFAQAHHAIRKANRPDRPTSQQITHCYRMSRLTIRCHVVERNALDHTILNNGHAGRDNYMVTEATVTLVRDNFRVTFAWIWAGPTPRAPALACSLPDGSPIPCG